MEPNSNIATRSLLVPSPQLRLKPVMDEHGNWIAAPHELWRDERGWHDRPASKREGRQ